AAAGFDPPDLGEPVFTAGTCRHVAALDQAAEDPPSIGLGPGEEARDGGQGRAAREALALEPEEQLEHLVLALDVLGGTVAHLDSIAGETGLSRSSRNRAKAGSTAPRTGADMSRVSSSTSDGSQPIMNTRAGSAPRAP